MHNTKSYSLSNTSKEITDSSEGLNGIYLVTSYRGGGVNCSGAWLLFLSTWANDDWGSRGLVTLKNPGYCSLALTTTGIQKLTMTAQVGSVTFNFFRLT